MNMDSINDIISNLSPNDIEMLKGVASSILGGSSASQPAQSSQQGNTPKSPENPKGNNQEVQALSNLGMDGVDFEMIMKAKNIFEKMNNTQNKNVDLIMALKPHLSKESQNKADTAMRILRLFEVLPLLRELF